MEGSSRVAPMLAYCFLDITMHSLRPAHVGRAVPRARRSNRNPVPRPQVAAHHLQPVPRPSHHTPHLPRPCLRTPQPLRHRQQPVPHHGVEVRSVDPLAPSARHTPDQQRTRTGFLQTGPWRIDLVAQVADVAALYDGSNQSNIIALMIARTNKNENCKTALQLLRNIVRLYLPVFGVAARQVVVAVARNRRPTRINQLGGSPVALVRTDNCGCVSQRRGVNREHRAGLRPVVARPRHIRDPIPERLFLQNGDVLDVLPE